MPLDWLDAINSKKTPKTVARRSFWKREERLDGRPHHPPLPRQDYLRAWRRSADPSRIGLTQAQTPDVRPAFGVAILVPTFA